MNAITVSGALGVGRMAISRRELWLWLLAFVVIGDMAHTAGAQTFADVLGAPLHYNLICALAVFVIAERIWRSDAFTSPNMLDWAAAAAIACGLLVAGLIPSRLSIGLVATFAGMALFWNYRSDTNLRAASMVLLALAVHMVWARLVFLYFQPEIVRADALATELWLFLLGEEVTRAGNLLTTDGVHRVVMVGQCSSFNNISLALLATGAAILHLRDRFVRSDIAWLAAIVAAMIITNVVRLGAFASSREAYDFWHEGAGAPILTIAQTILVLILAFTAAVSGRRSL